jgi:RNAse (barnase) inhibitor barstar
MEPTSIKKNEVVALATRDLKLASLLYDYVYPVDIIKREDNLPESIIYHPIKVFNSPDDPANEEIRSTFNKNIDPLFKILLAEVERPSGVDLNKIFDRVEFGKIEMINTFVRLAHSGLSRVGIRSVPLFYDYQNYDRYYEFGEKICLQVELFNYPIVDTSCIEWSHILDIRKDKSVFHRKIRDFRIFLLDNYAGKDADFIYDDLQKKIDEYKEACKLYDLKLTQTKTKILIDPKSYPGTILLSSLHILNGSPALSGLTALAGFMIDLGRIKITIDQKKLEYKTEINNPELAYLVELKELELENNNQEPKF